MADRGVQIRIGAEARDALNEIDRVGDSMRGLEGDAAKAAQGVGRQAERMGREMRGAGDDADRAGIDFDKSYDRIEGGAHGTASAVGEAFGEGGGIQNGLGSATEAVESFAEMFGPAGTIISFVGGFAIGAIVKFFDTASEKAEEATAAAESYYQALMDGAGQVDQAFKTEQIEAFYDEHTKLSTWIEREYPRVWAKLDDALGGEAAAIAEVTSELDDNITRLIRKSETTEGLTQTERDHLQGLLRLNGVLEDNNITLEQGEQKQRVITAAIEDGTDATQEATDATDSYGRKLDGLPRKFDLAAEAAKRANWKIRGSIARGEQSAASASGSQMNPGTSNTGQYHAAGGPVEANRATWVGERGPEIFVPQTAGTIVPNHGLNGIGGSVTINVTTSDPDRMAAKTAQALRRHHFRQGT